MNKISYYAYYVDDKGIMTIYTENNSVAEISECNGLNTNKFYISNSKGARVI